MNAWPTFTINPAEEFPHLDRAPIVEAVIHWRARSETALDRDNLLERLKTEQDAHTVSPSKRRLH